MKEIAILKKLNHKNIIHLDEVINDEEKEKIYLVMEFAGKGPIMSFDEDTELFNINEFYLNEEKNKTDFTEEEIRDIVRELVSGLDYCKFLLENLITYNSTYTGNSPSRY